MLSFNFVKQLPTVGLKTNTNNNKKNLQCELAGFLGVYQKACLAHELGEIFCSVTCKEKNTHFVWIMNAKYMIFTYSIAVK